VFMPAVAEFRERWYLSHEGANPLSVPRASNAGAVKFLKTVLKGPATEGPPVFFYALGGVDRLREVQGVPQTHSNPLSG
jgi:hypothetical protein